MAWVKIASVSTITNSRAAVTVKVRKPRKTGGPVLVVTIAAQRLQGGLAFWSIGTAVDALIGDGEHVGCLRIERGEEFRVTALGSKTSCSLMIPLPRSIKGDDCRRFEATALDWNDDWIEIALPGQLLPPVSTRSDQTVVGILATSPVSPGGAKRVGAGFRTGATKPGAPRPAAGGR